MTAVVLATHAEGQLRVFTRADGDGLRPRAVLDVEHAEPELLATLSADLADALGWLPIELPARPPRAQAVEASAPPELPAAAPVKTRRSSPRRVRSSAEVEVQRQQLVGAIAERPGVTTAELATLVGQSTQQVLNMLGDARRRHLVRLAGGGPGQVGRWYPQ